MNQTEIVACIHKHIGKSDNMGSLVALVEEVSKITANEEREACAKVCDTWKEKWNVPGILPAKSNCAGTLAMKIRERSSVE